jgi:hypothetical protein
VADGPFTPANFRIRIESGASGQLRTADRGLARDLGADPQARTNGPISSRPCTVAGITKKAPCRTSHCRFKRPPGARPDRLRVLGTRPIQVRPRSAAARRGPAGRAARRRTARRRADLPAGLPPRVAGRGLHGRRGPGSGAGTPSECCSSRPCRRCPSSCSTPSRRPRCTRSPASAPRRPGSCSRWSRRPRQADPATTVNDHRETSCSHPARYPPSPGTVARSGQTVAGRDRCRAAFGIFHTVDAAIGWPRPTSSPRMRR